MSVLPHHHTFSATLGGYVCTRCQAFVTDAQVAANPAASPAMQADERVTQTHYKNGGK